MKRTFYQRTQPGTLIVVVMMIGLCLEAATALRNTWSLPELLVAALLTAIAIVFSTMTIAVFDDEIQWWLSFGLFRQKVSLSEIQFAVTKRVTLFNGLGIRTNGRDWLWIVSGSDVVTLELRNGKNISLGSSDAQSLALLVDDLLKLTTLSAGVSKTRFVGFTRCDPQRFGAGPCKARARRSLPAHNVQTILPSSYHEDKKRCSRLCKRRRRRSTLMKIYLATSLQRLQTKYANRYPCRSAYQHRRAFPFQRARSANSPRRTRTARRP